VENSCGAIAGQVKCEPMIDFVNKEDKNHGGQAQTSPSCILNNLKPTKKKEKNILRRYLIKKLGVKDLLPKTWKRYSKGYVERYWPKFNVWYWRPQ
jgi:hypothetical protein